MRMKKPFAIIKYLDSQVNEAITELGQYDLNVGPSDLWFEVKPARGDRKVMVTIGYDSYSFYEFLNVADYTCVSNEKLQSLARSYLSLKCLREKNSVGDASR
ncbi:hypothetical protein A3K63_02405 [Candidatus Micrarchaeota archaeon RBG_16_49_10]|nr:MAG: hypothetical protein A3K63_02405 [Candidatus Micrarchaeota archaeon RBG_16_49_10]